MHARTDPTGHAETTNRDVIIQTLVAVRNSKIWYTVLLALPPSRNYACGYMYEIGSVKRHRSSLSLTRWICKRIIKGRFGSVVVRTTQYEYVPYRLPLLTGSISSK